MSEKTSVYVVQLRSGGGRGFIATGIKSNPASFGQTNDRLRRLADGVKDRLEAITGNKPTLDERKRQFIVSLTEEQVKDVESWEHVRNVKPIEG